ncbi:hypothetical protein AGDE_15097 [Angomonas deanei]|uniref:Uncharacterized protein n=1 Tax=Angomonas deanei TaxID=59799 RepID=A0A7G2CNK3_9TRYP|nr:hypothetical protein AGDE_15097 [Angomonas deanei]CAD2221360.1 hypothetical protein, conserved [Angomonas deanei]|eukprot:EPY19694.1 hypothetical protein AGDE_15097 [Angomonas deanei]
MKKSPSPPDGPGSTLPLHGHPTDSRERRTAHWRETDVSGFSPRSPSDLEATAHCGSEGTDSQPDKYNSEHRHIKKMLGCSGDHPSSIDFGRHPHLGSNVPRKNVFFRLPPRKVSPEKRGTLPYPTLHNSFDTETFAREVTNTLPTPSTTTFVGSPLTALRDRAKTQFLGDNASDSEEEGRNKSVGPHGSSPDVKYTLPRSSEPVEFNSPLTVASHSVLFRHMTSQQTTTSPLRFNEDDLFYARTADEREVAMKSSHKGNLFLVRQTRNKASRRLVFDPSFLSVCVNDEVEFNWSGESSHILETDRSYRRVVPGGHNSVDADGAHPSSQDPAHHLDYKTFRVMFSAPGDYYFVCSSHKKNMRLHVQVGDYKPPIKLYAILSSVAVLVFFLSILAVALGLAYGLQAKDLILPKEDATSSEQYEFVKNIQKIITLNLIPWFAVGILIFLFVLIFFLVYRGYKCCVPKRQGVSNKGVPTRTRRQFSFILGILCVLTVLFLFVAFGLHLNMIYALNTFMSELVTNMLTVLNSISLATNQVDYLVNQSEVLFPDVDTPVGDMIKVTKEVNNILRETTKWINIVEDIGQAVFSALPILLFMSLNIGFYAAAIAIGSLVLRYRRYMTVMVWLFGLSTGVYACCCGMILAERRLIQEVYLNAEILVDTPQDAPAHWGLENTVISEVFDFCDVNNTDISFVSEYVTDILSSINNTLDDDGKDQFAVVFQYFTDLVPATLEAMVNYTDYIYANLEVIDNILKNDATAVDDFFRNDVVSFLSTLTSVVGTFAGLSNCKTTRQAIAMSTPYLKEIALPYNTALLVFMLLVFVLSLPLFLFATMVVYSLANPQKSWYEARTGRYFRFRYCFKVHQKILIRGPKASGMGLSWAKEVLTDAVPFMSRLVYVRLLCIATAVLLFFDSICLVLYNDVTGRKRNDRILRAIGYIGCGILLFLLLGFVFRKLLIRTLLHAMAFVCTLALLVLCIIQCVIGCMGFADCIKKNGFELKKDANGIYTSACSLNGAGHNIEIAIFGFLVALSCISTLVTLGMLLFNEPYLSAWMKKHTYEGKFSFLADYSAVIRHFFKDSLNVKRVYLALLIVVVVVILVVLAVEDTNKKLVIKVGGTTTIPSVDGLVQVVYPDQECNGNKEYCKLPINQYTWATTHNSFSSLEDGFVVPNHYYNIQRQLKSGYRSFMVDLYYDYDNRVNGTQSVYLCHGACLSGRQSFLSLLEEYRRFLDTYKGQVVMVMLEQYVNGTDVAALVKEAGLEPYVWRDSQMPPNRNPNFRWPTLGELVSSNQRFLIFSDQGGDSSRMVGKPDWLRFQFAYQYENDYTTTQVSDFRCGIGRGWCTDLEETNTLEHYEISDFCDRFNCSDSPSGSSSVVVVNSTIDGVVVKVKDRYYNQTRYELYLDDLTNCSAYVDPEVYFYTNGSDFYNDAYHKGNPPNVASKLSTVNHMITIGGGSPAAATQANEPSVVQSHVHNCSQRWGAPANIVAVDFWSIKNPLVVLDEMNRDKVK